MKDKFEINLMYSELKVVMAKNKAARWYWAINHDLTLLIGKALRLL